ncbi:ferritin-like domain-containing protein [Lentzea sp. NPDC059081]|uniref:ferritin-like domain-containing protein n=1 Tax=Lentzea sp. NPDC059081 TaxID=3346719 RepID=UPI0036BA25AE
MSVFHLPRVHFAGVATTQLPTGPRTGLVDLATNRPLTADGSPFPPDRSPAEYDGPPGDHAAGNGHFVLDASVSAVELVAGEVSSADPLVGSKVDFWGHYNEYLQTTVNRARVFDLDPSSNWTTTLVVGLLGFGRVGRSHDRGYAMTGVVHGFQPPRWHDFRHGGSAVHQFVVTAEDLTWLGDMAGSPAVAALAQAGADGLVVQFCLTASAPTLDAPRRHDLRGTIAPWRCAEMRTWPAGRLMVPEDPDIGPHLFTVDTVADGVTFNLVGALGPGLPPEDLELRTAESDRLVGSVAAKALADAERGGGLVWSPAVDEPGQEALLLVSAQTGQVLSREQEVVLQADDACLVLEHPRRADDAGHDVDVEFRSFVRGRPAPVRGVRLHQVPNPRALPLADDAAEARIVHFHPIATETGQDGVGRFRVRGARAGSARVLLTTTEPGPLSYDNDDATGFWAAAGGLAVRVLPDDWWLDDLPDDAVTFETVYREVFAPYEALYPFMRQEVFSLADRGKVETYAKLIWQMCDPANKPKTYYMPPTRDLSEPKAQLLLRYLRAQQVPRQVLRSQPARATPRRGIRTRDELVAALRDAVTLELAVMVQYLYAAYTVPTYGAGVEYVRRGDWTPEQLAIACGDGGRTLDGGVRGTLIRVAREEMIHFLAVNNILQAVGEPFHVPVLDFGSLNGTLPIPLDFALEPLNPASVHRFVCVERPEGLVDDVRLGERAGRRDEDDDHHRYDSISELYQDIRDGLCRVPGLFAVRPGRGGGEHHLFLREEINRRHPDYQVEVDDLASALAAVDVVTEQGEGGDLADGEAEPEQSHYAAFVDMAATLRATDWVPSYPAARNPTVRRGDLTREYVPDPEARELMALFNEAYAVMFQLVVQHFGGGPDTSLRRSRLMNAAIDVMTGIMRPLGELLVTMPSGVRGRTAGPSFELDRAPGFLARHDVAVHRVSRRLEAIASRCASIPLVPAQVAEISALLADQVRSS